jgi:hypothetical protein
VDACWPVLMDREGRNSWSTLALTKNLLLCFVAQPSSWCKKLRSDVKPTRHRGKARLHDD